MPANSSAGVVSSWWAMARMRRKEGWSSAGLDARDVGVYHLDLAGELGLAESALFAGVGDVCPGLVGRASLWSLSRSI